MKWGGGNDVYTYFGGMDFDGIKAGVPGMSGLARG